MWYIPILSTANQLWDYMTIKIAEKNNSCIWCYVMQTYVYNSGIKDYSSLFLFNHKVVITMRDITVFKVISKFISLFLISTKFHIYFTEFIEMTLLNKIIWFHVCNSVIYHFYIVLFVYCPNQVSFIHHISCIYAFLPSPTPRFHFNVYCSFSPDFILSFNILQDV